MKNPNPTAHQALEVATNLFSECKGTKAEHVFLEKCLFELARAVHHYEPSGDSEKTIVNSSAENEVHHDA